jgi:hypothetical protein
VQHLIATQLMELASNERAAFEVRAGARQGLGSARARLAPRTDTAGATLRQEIERYLTQPTPSAPTPALPLPPGEPIG